MQERQRLAQWHARLRRNMILSTVGVLLWAAAAVGAGWLYIRFTGIDIFRTPMGRPLAIAVLAPIVVAVVMQRKWLHCPHCGKALETQPFRVPDMCTACGTQFCEE